MSEQLMQYLYILLYLIGGGILGYLIEKFILKKIQFFALKTKWQLDDIIVESLHGLVIAWIMIICFSSAANYFSENEKFLAIANKISISVTIVTFAILAARIFVKTIQLKTSHVVGNTPSTSIILNIIRIVVLLIATMLILQTFGVSIAPMLTALGVGGLAVALALQETLSNLFAGIQIIASKKIRNGDYIKLNSGEEGYVEDITWRNTIIRAMQNNLIIVPNSKLSTAIITNYNFPDTALTIPVEVGVGYDSDLQLVENITIETAKEVLQVVPGGVKDFQPVVRFHTFGDSSIDFAVVLKAHEFGNQFLIKHEFIKALQKKYKEKGIEIPFPVRTVIVKQ